MMSHKCKILKMLAKENISGNAVNIGFDKFRHWHSDIEYIYIHTGYLILEVDGENIKLQEKEFFVVASNVVHTFMESSDDAILYIARIPVENMRTFGLSAIETLYLESLHIKSTDDLVGIFNDLVFAEYQIYNELYTTAKAFEFTTLILAHKDLIIRRIQSDVVEESDITAEIQRFIEKSLTEKITLAMLADHLNISENYCSAIIKQKTNFNFLEYINQVRLREAERYLRTTNMQMTEICYETGFNSIQSFNRNFKKIRGITPTEYRKGIKKTQL